SAHPANPAIERELPHHHIFRQLFLDQPAIRAQDAHGHGQIEPGAFFLDVRRRQVDGDLRERNFVAAVSQRGADPLPALPHGRVGQADRLEIVVRAPRGADVHLYFNNVGVDSVNGGALRLEEHACGLSPCGDSILAREAAIAKIRAPNGSFVTWAPVSSSYVSTVSIESGPLLKVPSTHTLRDFYDPA